MAHAPQTTGLPGALGLIGGTGRSGTTILKEIFSRHPDVATTIEWRLTIDPDGLVDFYRSLAAGWSPFLFARKIERLRNFLLQLGKTSLPMKIYRRILRNAGMTSIAGRKILPAYDLISIADECPRYHEIVEALLSKLTEFSYEGQWLGNGFLEKTAVPFSRPFTPEELGQHLGEFYHSLISSVLASRAKKHFIEDNTWNILAFDSLRKIAPEAKLVHIYRDPRDVAASYRSEEWAPTAVPHIALFFGALLDRWWAIRERLPEDSFLEISLEALVKEPRRILQRVCDFWGIPWHDALLETDLSRSHSGRWRKDFSVAEQETLQRLLAPYLERLGYAR